MFRKDYEIKDVDREDICSIIGALIEIAKILEDLSYYIEEATDGKVTGSNLYELVIMLDEQIKDIEERMGE